MHFTCNILLRLCDTYYNYNSTMSCIDKDTIRWWTVIVIGFIVVLLSESIKFHYIQKRTEPWFSYATDSNYDGVDSNEGQLIENKFDKVYDTLYRQANPVVSPSMTDKRQKFVLETWIRRSSSINDEDRLLLADTFLKSSSVIEFGSGETTHIASITGVPRYVCIDVDAENISNMREIVDNESFRFFLSDIGKVDEYGYPYEDMLPKVPYDYQVVPLILEKDAFDFYLVHGITFKGSCIIIAFLHAIKCGADLSNVVVGVIERNHHPLQSIISEVADLLSQSDNVSLYKLKSSMTEHDLFYTWLALEKNALLISQPLPNGVSAFQFIADHLFAKAMEPPPIEKRYFYLSDTEERDSTSLEDSDRQLIGDLYYNASSVFEFGLGESSAIASWVGVPRFAGVDTDDLKLSYLQTKIQANHFRLYLGDVGNVMECGEPADIQLTKNHFDYQIAPLVAESFAFDLYYIDGPWRQACVAISFLHAIKHKGDLSSIKVILHDSLRSEYDVIEQKIADLITRTDHMWVFQLKNGVTEDTIWKYWSEVSHIM